MGYARPQVYARPAVGIFVTGDELVDAGIKPTGAKIRNSNGPQLEAQCTAMHLPVVNYGIIPDSKDALREVLERSTAGKYGDPHLRRGFGGRLRLRPRDHP